MKSKVSAFLLIATIATAAVHWQSALPGYPYSFPKDHFAHPDFKTEWWYYTGNLHTPEGRRFGFELTFFRAAQDTAAQQRPSIWNPDQIWLAHLALSDVEGKQFLHTERMNRSGPGLAGASLQEARFWNGNWSVRWVSPDGAQTLQAVADRFRLTLQLHPTKAAVIHGKKGISEKGPHPGEASHYISFTRLESSGTLEYNNQKLQVEGLTWMDHEFFTEQNDADFGGWDWFAIQLDNREELMLYRLRLKSGAASPFSSGTYIDDHGTATNLSASDFILQPGGTWHSSQSGATYPLEWSITIPKLSLSLQQTTPLQKQELFSNHSVTPTYWEGAVDYRGSDHGKPITGMGYLEMTGYGSQTRPIF